MMNDPQNPPSPELTITITGECNTGKTALAVALHDLLRVLGFATVKVEDPDLDIGGRPCPTGREIKRRLRAIAAKGTRVRITTNIVRSAPKTV